MKFSYNTANTTVEDEDSWVEIDPAERKRSRMLFKAAIITVNLVLYLAVMSTSLFPSVGAVAGKVLGIN